MDIYFWVWAGISVLLLALAYVCLRRGDTLATLALMLIVGASAPADAAEPISAIEPVEPIEEIVPLDTSDSWLDFSEFGMPNILEPLQGRTKIFMGDAYSYHFDRSYDYNEVHTTYGFEYKINDRFAINVSQFENSYSERSNALAVVYTWREYEFNSNVSASIGAQAGVADGYEKAKYNASGFAPIVAPFADIVVYKSIGARISVWNFYVANVSFYLEF